MHGGVFKAPEYLCYESERPARRGFVPTRAFPVHSIPFEVMTYMLCLASEDIGKALSFDKTIDAVEEAFLVYEKDTFQMPLRTQVEHGENTLIFMPCFIPEAIGTKLVSIFPENVGRDLPTLNGLMVLFDGSTGRIRAVMPGAALTARRTGAVGGVAVRTLAPADVSVLGIVGAGVQGFHQALFSCSVRAFRQVQVFDRREEQVEAFIRDLSDMVPKIEVVQAQSTEQLLSESDVIVTATDSNHPVLPDNGPSYEDKVIVGIGSYRPEMREFPDALFDRLDALYVDTEHALEESGDVIDPVRQGRIPRERVVTLGKIISGTEALSETASVRCFKSVGMALFDVVVADRIVGEAERKGLGKVFDLE